MKGFLARSLAFWAGPADGIRLDAFRVGLTLSLLVYMAAWWRDAPEWLTNRGFHTSWRAAGIYTPVLPPLPEGALAAFGGLLFGSILAVLLGAWLRTTLWVVLLCVGYVTFADPLMAYTLNRLYLVSYLALALAPAGGYFSVGPGGKRLQSVWPIRMLQTTILLQYFTAAVCKLGPGDWARDPLVLWGQAQGWYRTEAAALALRVLPLGIWSWMQATALSFELFAPLLLTCRRLRPLGFMLGGAFQILTALMMDRLIYFSLQLLSFYVLFLSDHEVHWLRNRFRGAKGAAAHLTSLEAAG